MVSRYRDTCCRGRSSSGHLRLEAAGNGGTPTPGTLSISDPTSSMCSTGSQERTNTISFFLLWLTETSAQHNKNVILDGIHVLQ
jgi:hypothetical protein